MAGSDDNKCGIDHRFQQTELIFPQIPSHRHTQLTFHVLEPAYRIHLIAQGLAESRDMSSEDDFFSTCKAWIIVFLQPNMI